MVGVHQDLQIWNKGFDAITVEWFGSSRLVESDESYATGPIGDLLAPGNYAVDAGPYAMPVIRVIDPVSSTLHLLTAGDAGLGPVEIGMTLAQASAALGQDITVDENLAPGPRCWLAVVEGDPYSPIVSVAGDGSAASVVTAISVDYPEAAIINPDSVCN